MKFITAILLSLNITTAPIDAGYKDVIHDRGPLTAPVFREIFREAERAYRLPRNLLVAIAYEESRFRRDVINCKLSSSAGAKGIMQIILRWHPGVDPCKVDEAIPYAGKYLSYLSKRYEGDWGLALAAYNWGLGNVDKFLQGEKGMPRVVQRYVARVVLNSGSVKHQHRVRDSPGGNKMVVIEGEASHNTLTRCKEYSFYFHNTDGMRISATYSIPDIVLQSGSYGFKECMVQWDLSELLFSAIYEDEEVIAPGHLINTLLTTTLHRHEVYRKEHGIDITQPVQLARREV